MIIIIKIIIIIIIIITHQQDWEGYLNETCIQIQMTWKKCSL